MKLLPVIVSGAAFFAAVALQAKIERNVDKTFTVTGVGTVRLETRGGSIRVVPGAEGVVKVTAHETIRADSDAEADKLLQDLDLAFEQSGNDVHASAKYTRESGRFHFGSWPPVQVDFVATVPASFAADVRTSGGGITLGDLGGTVAARTSGGGVKLGKLGGRVDARTSGGNISLEEARGDVKLSTSGGNIKVGRIAGPADLSTSGGSIDIETVGQQVKAHTSGGSIRAGLAGMKDDSSLSTSGGSVRVTVDRSAAFRLDASTSGGSVNADGLTITLHGSDQKRSKLVGDVNGGGPELKLRSSGGSITIQAR